MLKLTNIIQRCLKGRNTDKLRFRYPQGESYEDVIRRLEPIILSLEQRAKPTLWSLPIKPSYASSMGILPINKEDVPHLNIPLHTVIKLTPQTYGCSEMQFGLPPIWIISYKASPMQYTHPVLPERVQQFVDVIHQHGGTAYIAGGFVRDMLLDRPCKDIDFEIHGLTPKNWKPFYHSSLRTKPSEKKFWVYGGCYPETRKNLR